ncbi:hypothetical protein T4C_1911 [Trichinella pseudospiralis]|uniref:Uncharacterized protein n=1 Tax=Trichinella pseudospiralis TaxID=6337 RepID=A0A0V1JU80_TRIPS|nr:hypothetical protein T4C_1911 [Trichinella pseudospiralis]
MKYKTTNTGVNRQNSTLISCHRCRVQNKQSINMKIIRVALLCNELNGIGSRRGILSSPRQAFNK